MWDLTDKVEPRRAATQFAGFGSWVNAVAYSPDGTTVAAASSDGFVQTYQASDGQVVAKLPGPGAFTAVQFVGPGGNLLTAEVGGTARLWPYPGPTLTGYTDTVWNVVATTASPMLAVAAGRQDGRVYLYDTSDPADPRQVDVLSAPADAGAPDGSAWISPDGRWIAAGTATGRVVVWERNPKTGRTRLAGTEEFSDQLIEALAISDDGTKLAAIADDSRVGVWNLQPGSKPQLVDAMTVAGLPLAIAFSPDPSLLAVGTTGRQVHLWQLSGRTKPTELPVLTGFENYVYSVTFDPTGRYVAAGSTDRTIRIWDLTDPTHANQLGSELRGPQDTVYFLDWSRQGDRLAAAAAGGTLWLWDVTNPATPVQLAALNAAEGNLFTTTFTPDGTTVLAAGSGRTVNSWKVDLPKILETTCTNTGTPMTEAEWERLVPDVPYTPPCAV
jgi:WD40 repeat protein